MFLQQALNFGITFSRLKGLENPPLFTHVVQNFPRGVQKVLKAALRPRKLPQSDPHVIPKSANYAKRDKQCISQNRLKIVSIPLFGVQKILPKDGEHSSLYKRSLQIIGEHPPFYSNHSVKLYIAPPPRPIA